MIAQHDDLGDLEMPPALPTDDAERLELILAKLPEATLPAYCRCDHPIGAPTDDGDFRCVMCGRREAT